MSASFLAAAAQRSLPQTRFSVDVDLEAMREVETSKSGVQWRVASPCASGACPAKVARYYPLHPPLFEAQTFPREWLSPTFAEALADGSEAALLRMLRAEVPDAVHSFDMVTPAFCAMLCDELTNYEASGLPLRRPNSMNSYGLVLNDIGLRPLLDELLKVILPLTTLLFPEEGSRFDAHHSFVVKYRRGEDTSLDMHHDDSEVTLNVCLGKAFTGATLSFCGGYAADAHRKHTCTYTHERCRAVLHRGTHRHGADEIESGERVSLIVWAKSSAYRQNPAYLRSSIGRRRRLLREGLSAELAPTDERPDPICLSVRHDPDFGEHKVFPDGRSYQVHERRQHVATFPASRARSRAIELKALATADFAAGQWAMAASRFAAAGEYVARGEEADADAAAAADAEVPFRAMLWMNEAQCHLKLGDPRTALTCCTSALGATPQANLSAGQRAKGHYRRALSLMELAEFEAASKDLLAAAKLEPANRLVRSKFTECKALVESARERERALYRRAVACNQAGTETGKAANPTEGKGWEGEDGEDEVCDGLVPIFEALEEVD